MRRLIVAVGSIEILVALGFAVLMLQSTDPLGAAIGRGMVELLAVPVGFLVLPGFALGLADRWLPLALGLVVIAIPAAAVLWRLA